MMVSGYSHVLNCTRIENNICNRALKQNLHHFIQFAVHINLFYSLAIFNEYTVAADKEIKFILPIHYLSTTHFITNKIKLK